MSEYDSSREPAPDPGDPAETAAVHGVAEEVHLRKGQLVARMEALYALRPPSELLIPEHDGDAQTFVQWTRRGLLDATRNPAVPYDLLEQ